MDLFDKATRIAQNVGENVVNSAKNVGGYIKNTTAEQRELAGLKIQLDTVTKKLDTYYAEIGKKYVEYVENFSAEESFNVDDILEQMKPDLELKAETEGKLAEKEQAARDAETERAKARAQEKFDREKRKLEEALRLDIITVDEYNDKLDLAQKKLDNFDILRKIDLQYDMQIITKEEYEAKVNEILK